MCYQFLTMKKRTLAVLLLMIATLSYGQIDKVPQYVLDHAPLVHLKTDDAFRPSSIAAQLKHTHPTVNATSITNGPHPRTLYNLSRLNRFGHEDIFLSSNGDFTKLPPWTRGILPDAQGKTHGAPTAAIIVHRKHNAIGTVDAFYMYFYAYNRGNLVLGQEFGNHVGDWEHNMIRFVNGSPKYIWYSQHSNGAAYKWDAVEKASSVHEASKASSAGTKGKRPIVYSSNGTHANWATAGTHEHTLPDVAAPGLLLVDYTDKGPVWDPVKNAYFYSVQYPNNTNGKDDRPRFAALQGPDGGNDGTRPPVDWLYFEGHWGDEQLPASDPRQKVLKDTPAVKYTSGPNGPRFKGLNRVDVCPDNGNPCIRRRVLVPGS